MIMQNLKRSSVFVGLLAAGAIAGGAAFALVVGGGGSQLRVDVRSEVAATASNVVAFNDVPGANTVLSVPAGTSRLFIARFTAESRCSGAAAAPVAVCSLRVIATNTVSGVSTVFDPNSGIDYAFDTNQAGAVDDLLEGNAMERSKRLQSGTYRLRVQRAVSNAGTTFVLDDWHLSVEMSV